MARPETFELPTPRLRHRRESHCSRRSAYASRERQWNVARDFLGTFRRDPSVLLPRFPVLFPLSFQQRGAKCSDLFEKTGAGEGNRTLDIQLGKLSFYH